MFVRHIVPGFLKQRRKKENGKNEMVIISNRRSDNGL